MPRGKNVITETDTPGVLGSIHMEYLKISLDTLII